MGQIASQGVGISVLEANRHRTLPIDRDSIGRLMPKAGCLRPYFKLEPMRYEIILSSGAESDLDQLRAKDRTQVLDAIERHLRYEPEKTSKSRIKRLRDLDRPQYRLRVDDLRVFYDVLYEINGGFVEILAIKQKDESVVWLIENGE